MSSRFIFFSVFILIIIFSSGCTNKIQYNDDNPQKTSRSIEIDDKEKYILINAELTCTFLENNASSLDDAMYTGELLKQKVAKYNMTMVRYRQLNEIYDQDTLIQEQILDSMNKTCPQALK